MWCRIRIQGHLSELWTQWLGDLSIENQPNGQAVLSGEVADQSALYVILGRVRDIGITMLAIECHCCRGADHETGVRSGESLC